MQRYNYVELTEKEEDILEKKLVWILADRRSGTTWLGMDLLSHQTKYIDEPLLGHHLGSFQAGKKGIRLTTELQHTRDDYFFSDTYEFVWKKYLRKLILNRIHAQTKDFSKFIILKEPTGTFGAEIITKCLPKSKKIIVIRDGRDILDSKLDAVTPGGWGTLGDHNIVWPIERRNEFIKSRSEHWVKIMEIISKIYDDTPKELCHKITYEGLLVDTYEHLKKIYEFIGITIDKEQLEKIISTHSFDNIPDELKGPGKFKRFATPGKWKENFSKEEISLIENIMKETLQKLGYM